MKGDPEEFKPETVLSLENTEEVQNWTPIKATLDAFIDARKKTEEVLKSRMRNIITS